jgi:large subunit ribosomal protein L1
MTTKENFVKAIQELKKHEAENKEQRKFTQSVDLIINLKDYDIKKTTINTFVLLPHKIKDKKIAGFLEKKSNFVDTITRAEFEDFRDKKKMKRLIKEYDFFIANAKLMPTVAATFGRGLGPAGKMPSPQLGVVMAEDENTIKTLMKKIETAVKLRTKEPTIKVSIGKQSDKEEDLAENAVVIYNEVFKNLPKLKENLRSVLVKYTMSKPVRVAMQ